MASGSDDAPAPGPAGCAAADLASLLTAVIVTSPIVSHPSSELLDRLILSMTRHLDGFGGCRQVIVCDGYTVGAKDPGKRNFGVITEQQAGQYEEFKRALRGQNRPGVTVLELAEWTGFALGLQAALDGPVSTPLVLVCPHDYEFLHGVDLPGVCELVLRRDALQNELPRIEDMLRGFSREAARDRNVARDESCVDRAVGTDNGDEPLLVSYVGFTAGNQVKQLRKQVQADAVRASGFRLWPLHAWKENPHVASVAAYRRLVYGHDRFRAGEFIEDRLGNVMRDDIKAKGPRHHRERYGMYLLDALDAEGASGLAPTLYHMDGRCYKTVEERLGLGWKVADWEVERAKAASSLCANLA